MSAPGASMSSPAAPVHAPLNPSTPWGETAGSWRKRVFSFSMVQRPCVQARSSSGSCSHHREGFPVQLSPCLGSDRGLLALDEGLTLYKIFTKRQTFFTLGGGGGEWNFQCPHCSQLFACRTRRSAPDQLVCNRHAAWPHIPLHGV